MHLWQVGLKDLLDSLTIKLNALETTQGAKISTLETTQGTKIKSNTALVTALEKKLTTALNSVQAGVQAGVTANGNCAKLGGAYDTKLKKCVHAQWRVAPATAKCTKDTVGLLGMVKQKDAFLDQVLAYCTLDLKTKTYGYVLTL